MKFQRDPIQTVAQASRLWPVVKDMPEMSAATATMDRLTYHSKRGISRRADDPIVKRRPETRPAGAAVKLRARSEGVLLATCAGEIALAFFVKQRARERPFGSRLSKNRKLVSRQQFLPFVICVCNGKRFASVCADACEREPQTDRSNSSIQK